MPKKPTEQVMLPSPMSFGVEEGTEVTVDGPIWKQMVIPHGAILEVCYAGASLGLGTEEWFAVLVEKVEGSVEDGWQITGRFLGTENPTLSVETVAVLEEGFVHLCPGDPCPRTADEVPLIHATRVRLWRPMNFSCTYLSGGGDNIFKAAVAKEKRSLTPRAPGAPAGKRPAARRAPANRGRGRGTTPGRGRLKTEALGDTISLVSDEEEGPAEEGGPASPITAARRGALRDTLRRTKERILGGQGLGRPVTAAEDLTGGDAPAGSSRAVGESRLVAGTAFNPVRQTPLRLGGLEDTSAVDTKRLTKKLSGGSRASSELLAQAVQQSARDADHRKQKKREKSRKDSVQQLLNLLKGKKKKDKKSRKAKRRRAQQDLDVAVKPDPGDPGGSSSSGYDSDSSRADTDRGRADSEEDTDLECEAPPRKRAAKQPGSVMEMLIRHAQEQMDRGSLLESDGSKAGLTSGIKVSTYFALLIRPFHATNSPLVRELYALAQSIDLLRMGRLPETADALASRFIAVHTALSEGNWLTASQLELFPLEPVASASTATMLEAQKHRRLVLKSQGWGQNTRWWGGAGKGKNYGSGNEKGRKGDQKGKGKGKWKGANRDQGWGSKGETNPWRDNKEDAQKKPTT